jgi:hypothetical protein
MVLVVAVLVLLVQTQTLLHILKLQAGVAQAVLVNNTIFLVHKYTTLVAAAVGH